VQNPPETPENAPARPTARSLADHSMPIAHALALTLLLLGWLLLGWQTAGSTSVTHDELWHLPVGVRNWQGDFAADRLNPPLSRLWAAIPLVMSGVQVSTAENGPEVGNRFVAEHDDFQDWYVRGRRLHLFWGLATGLLLYWWARQAAGPWAGLLSLTLYLTCPEVLAHASLVTPDVPAMFGFLLTSYCLSAWLQQPNWKRAGMLGVALGLLQGMKFTGVVFYPALLVVALWLTLHNRWFAPQENRFALRQLWGQLAAAMAVSLLVLAGSYGFQGLFQPLSAFSFQSGFLQKLQTSLGALSMLPVPVPADYLLGIDQQRAIMESPHPIFLDGIWQLSGFYTYYLKALLYKLPHGFQLLILFGLLISWQLGGQREKHRFLSLWLPVGILFFLASASNMQLGLRYILPMIPVLALTAGAVVYGLQETQLSTRILTGLGLFLLLISPLRYHPQHLAYFNELAGGPVDGRYHLLDSNLDWGQDLLRARDYIQAHPEENARLVYFGSLDPRRVGLQADLPPSWEPEPGLYLVSVNYVMGRPHTSWLPDGSKRSIDFMEFGYFQFFEPIGRAGYSIDIYRITADDLPEP